MIKPSTTAKLLGVVFDHELRWKEHVQQTIKRATKVNIVLGELRQLRPEQIRGMHRSSSRLCVHGLARSTPRQDSPTTPSYRSTDSAHPHPFRVPDSSNFNTGSRSARFANTPPTTTNHHQAPHSAETPDMECVVTRPETKEQPRIVRSVPACGGSKDDEPREA